MNCAESKDLLPLHVAGELEDDAGFIAHLAVCEGCARDAELTGLVWDLAGRAPEETVPDEAIQGVYDRIECWRRRPQRLSLTLLRLGTVAAAAILVAAGLARVSPRRGATPEAGTVNLMAEEPAAGYLEPAFGAIEAEDAGSLRLRSHSVSIDLRDWTVRTEVEEVFVNATDQRLEGTFTFPLPPDASLSRFAMEVNGVMVEGELVERVRAREVYEGIVRKMKDPALLEWMPGNIFKARIFPIEPRSEKRVILAYTQAPRLWNGAISYAYPLVSEKTKEHPPEQLAVRASYRFDRPVKRVECPTHRADVARRDDRSGRVTLELRNARPTSDFQVRLELEPVELAAAAHAPAGEDGFLGVAFAPALEAGEAPPGTFLFVVDRSARMGEADLALARRVVDQMIARLGPADRAGLLAHHVDTVLRAPEAVTAERKTAWREFLWGLKAEGASDVLGALSAAAAATPEGSTVIYVGKGVPTYGETDGGRVAAEGARVLQGMLFRAVLVGSDANEQGMSLIAAHRDGGVQSVRPGGDTMADLAAIGRTVAVRPVQDLRVDVEGVAVRDVFPTTRPVVFPGERVFFLARYPVEGPPRRAAVVVRGMCGGRPFERRTDVELAAGPTGHGSLARLWAQRALVERVAEAERRGNPADEVAAVVAMSRRFQVMTPYTSFLVLESEKAYEEHRIERARRRAEEAREEEEQRKRAQETSARPALDAKPGGEWEDLIRRLKAAHEVTEPQKLSQADEHYRLAERYYQAGDFEKAELESGKAVRINPGHVGAQALALEVRFILRRGKATPTTEEYDKYMREALVRHQQTLLEIDNAHARGTRSYNRGDYDQSEQEYRRILEYAKWMPTGVELETRRKQALDMLERTKEARGQKNLDEEKSRMRMVEEDAPGSWRVRIEQGQIEVTKHVRDGERYLNARMYDEARREFEDADFKIRHLPYESKAMNGLLPRVRDDAMKAENARLLETYRVESGQRRMAEAEASGHEAVSRREITRSMAHLLELSYMAVDQKRYDRAIQLADEVLRIDPNYAVARELKEDAEKTRHKEEYYDTLARKVEQWKRLTDDDGEAVIPYSKTVRFPSREEWAEISKRIGESVIKTGGGTGVEDDPDILGINRKLATMKIDMAFEDSKLEDILAIVRDFSGLNIVLDAEVKDRVDLEKVVSFEAKDVLLKEALRRLLSGLGLDYTVTEDRAVLIGLRERLELYDVRDLLGSAAPPMSGDDLVALVRRWVAADTWSGEGASIEFHRGMLIVRQTREAHGRIRAYLAELRGKREAVEQVEERLKELRIKLDFGRGR